VTPYSVAVGYHCLGGPCCFHPQDEVKMEAAGSTKTWYLTATLYSITTQKTLTHTILSLPLAHEFDSKSMGHKNTQRISLFFYKL
jgi:hypothetical protein